MSVTMEEGKQDIFGGGFNEQKDTPKKKDMSFSEGFGNIIEGFWHLFSGLKHIFFKKFPMNLLLLMLILAAAIFGTYYLKPETTGMVVYNVTQNITCPVCEEKECPECPGFDASLCNCTKEILHSCPDGRVVEDSADCDIDTLPTTCRRILDSSDYIEESSSISISIDDIDYKTYSNGRGYISLVKYSIVNNGDEKIKPKVEFKVYGSWNSDVASSPANYTVRFKDYLNKQDCVPDTKEFDSGGSLRFKGDEQTLRLELFDASKDPDEKIIAVKRKFLG